jgi:hypothetical protein
MRSLLCFFLTLASPGFADMSSPEGQLRAFANCAGRLTAQLEHQWLMQSEASDITQHQRSQIVDILHSIIPEDRGREVLSWRTDAIQQKSRRCGMGCNPSRSLTCRLHILSDQLNSLVSARSCPNLGRFCSMFSPNIEGAVL